MDGLTEQRAHPDCVAAGFHVCRKPSGRECIEEGCHLPAGTLWGPLWCPQHDQQRLNRISKQLAELATEH